MNLSFERREALLTPSERMERDLAQEEVAKAREIRSARRNQRWNSLQLNRAAKGVGAVCLIGLALAAGVASHFASENEAKILTAQDRQQAEIAATPQADKETALRNLCDTDPAITISGVPVCETFPPQPGPGFDPSQLPQEPDVQNP